MKTKTNIPPFFRELTRLCVGGGGGGSSSVPNKPDGFCGCKAPCYHYPASELRLQPVKSRDIQSTCTAGQHKANPNFTGKGGKRYKLEYSLAVCQTHWNYLWKYCDTSLWPLNVSFSSSKTSPCSLLSRRWGTGKWAK